MDLERIALEEGFAHARLVSTGELVFDPSFRASCEENLCGQYGANYSCPPFCGTPEEMRQRIVGHRQALVLQSIHRLPDQPDAAAFRAAVKGHNDASLRLRKRLQTLGLEGFLVGASSCCLCQPCAMTLGAPCPFPENRFSCMSACCIYVKGLAELCAMDYDCGPGRLGLFGMYVFG